MVLSYIVCGEDNGEDKFLLHTADYLVSVNFSVHSKKSCFHLHAGAN